MRVAAAWLGPVGPLPSIPWGRGEPVPPSRPTTSGLFSGAQRDTWLLSCHWLALPCQPSSHLALHKLNC